jgi:hypothetical protein
MARTAPATTPEASDLSGGAQAAEAPQVEVVGAVEGGVQEDVPTMKELKGVRYVGSADVKIFEVSDLAGVGVEVDEPLTWHSGNGFFVDAKHLTAAARDFLATQTDFVVE